MAPCADHGVLFCLGVDVELVNEFVDVEGRFAFARICRATCRVTVTPARIVHAPLDNALRAMTSDSFRARAVENLVEARALYAPLDTVWYRRNLRTSARLQVFPAEILMLWGGSETRAFEITRYLALALARISGLLLPAPEDVWNKTMRRSGSLRLGLERCKPWCRSHVKIGFKNIQGSSALSSKRSS